MRKYLAALVAVALLTLPLPIQAEEIPCPDPARPNHYSVLCLTDSEYLALGDPQPISAPPTPVYVAGVEQWRWHVSQFWPAWAVDRALRVMNCESGGYALAANPYSDARGLFQQRLRYWDGRAAAAGYPGASVFDPWVNIAVSHWLWAQTGTWSHWSCKG